MKKLFILFLIIAISLCCFVGCNDISGIDYVTVRTNNVSGVEYEYYIFSFFYSQNMMENYYEILVNDGKTEYFIQESYFYFQYARNAKGNTSKIPNSTVLFGVEVPFETTQITLTLCRCTTLSTNEDFEVLERIYSETFMV